MTWQSRIVSHGALSLDDVLFHDLNWRIHTKEQQAALKTVLDTVGWVQDCIVSANSGKLLDGHLRVILAERNGETEVPCVFVDVTAEEERIILASLDTITGMAATDDEKLGDLLASIENEDMAGLLRQIAEAEKVTPQRVEAPLEEETRMVRCPECGAEFTPGVS